MGWLPVWFFCAGVYVTMLFLLERELQRVRRREAEAQSQYYRLQRENDKLRIDNLALTKKYASLLQFITLAGEESPYGPNGRRIGTVWPDPLERGDRDDVGAGDRP